MSAQTQLPDPAAAYQLLEMNVDRQVFFHKLAAAGHVPRTEDEAALMYDLGHMFHQEHQVDLVKRAQADNNPYRRAHAEMSARLGHPQEKQAHAQARRGWAEALAQDPQYYNAVLALKAHAAAQ